MSDTQSIQVSKLEKLRTAWLPAVEFLFGEAQSDAEFLGFVVNEDAAKPKALFTNDQAPYAYKIEMPARSFTNDVMLLADVIQEMVRGLFPMGDKSDKPTALCEGTVVYGAIMAIKQVFGEESVDSYLNALRENVPTYYDAFSYVAVLLTEDPQAIKKLRAVQPCLYKVTKDDFDSAKIEINRKVRDVLLLTFRV